MTNGRTQWLVVCLARLFCFLMLVWLAFAATAIPTITCAYDVQTRHANTGYDVRSLSTGDYDSTVVPIANCSASATVGTSGLFSKIAEFLAAESTPRVFWSGGDAARDAAATWAKANGATTLEMTQAGQQLTQTTKGLDWLTQARPAWVDASRSFAEGAVGDVHVFQSGARGVSLQSIWRDTEFPTLMQNNNVNNIFYHVITPEGVTVVPH